MSVHKILNVVEYAPNHYEISLSKNNIEYKPGACVTIYNKPYSLCSSPNDDYLRILVKKIINGNASTKLCELKTNDEIEITEIFNYFYPGTAKYYCYIATGTGISPFISALKFYSNKPLLILYGAKTIKELYSLDWLEQNYKVSPATSRENNSRTYNGRITKLLHLIPINNDITYYLCGLNDMITEISSYLMNNGVSFNYIKQELFYI